MTRPTDLERRAADADARSDDSLKPVPRIAVQAFCDTQAVARVVEAAAADRRLAKAHVKVHMGGLAAAVDFYGSAPTPNLIIVESRETSTAILDHIDRLSNVCDAGTKVVVVGHLNDVLLYRELMRRGVSEYMVAPFDVLDLVRSVGDIYSSPDAGPLGRVIAVVGAKGGVGSSTVAHNVAWSISRTLQTEVVLADLDLAWGTAGLDFNQDPAQGIAEALAQPDRIDDVFLDRLLAKCTDHLSLLAAPSTLERAYDFEDAAFDPIVDTVRASVPTVVLDVPHMWTGWVRRVLRSADEVVIVAAPDLGNLRNAKNLIDVLKASRPNDGPPRLVLNQVGVAKRPEIKPDEFAKALEMEAVAVIPFDAGLFGTAANNGQMIAETDAKHPIGETFRMLGQVLTGRAEIKKVKKSPFAPLLAKLRPGKAG